MTTTSTEQFVVYRLGYHQNPSPIQSVPHGIDVINPFRLNLAPSNKSTAPDYNHITSHEPSKGSKAGELNVNDNANHQRADAIIKILSSQAEAAAAD